MARKKKLWTKKDQKALDGCILGIVKLVFLPVTLLFDMFKNGLKTPKKRRRRR